MSKFNLLTVWAVHSLGSVASVVGAGTWSMAAADGGSAVLPAALAALLDAVYFGLLQPAAYWILPVLDPRWWTWSGLAATLLVIAVNSGLVTLLIGLWRRRRAPTATG